ncbi:hypothetical protein [Planctomicrobium piriforme]|uniref:Uncharacterized protein n=1 Tax=Planctomicrobium piriforme TaxID=1576369 RepID=A0A1I3PD13_9PLAN|nr:hypothetical protein [Planctomicrobium piriforme]SFJ19363.1 hypothetical protein SAMN05421753_116112 [Planctomicrobium piriforme]
MAIKFRCPHCQQFLGISQNKAGMVTDCPTCGRTIRVPGEDGTVAPLPRPKLDLSDNQLVAALDALATIDRPAPVDPPRPAQAPTDVDPLPSPGPAITPDPLPNVEDAQDFIGINPRDVLRTLGEITHVTDTPKIITPETGLRFGPAVLLFACVLSVGCGILIGAGAFRNLATMPAAKPASIPKHAPQPPAVKAPMEGAIGQIAGSVTYADSGGSSRPDRGARVLLLPMVRRGTAKLGGSGFRVGADEVDRRLLEATAEVLGGAFGIADEQGKFDIPAQAAGRYGLLVASRYQSRPADEPVSEAARKFLELYFDRPDQLIGNVQYEFREITVDANPAGPREFHFPLR